MDMNAGDAQSKAAILIPIIMAGPLPIAALFGYFNDRLDRVTGLIIASSLGTVGYLWFGSLNSPLDGAAIPVGIILGCGMVTSVANPADSVLRNVSLAEARGYCRDRGQPRCGPLCT